MAHLNLTNNSSLVGFSSSLNTTNDRKVLTVADLAAVTPSLTTTAPLSLDLLEGAARQQLVTRHGLTVSQADALLEARRLNVTLNVTIQQRKLKEQMQHMHLAKTFPLGPPKVAAPPPPKDYSQEIQAMNHQMKQMQEMFENRKIAASSSVLTKTKEDVVPEDNKPEAVESMASNPKDEPTTKGDAIELSPAVVPLLPEQAQQISSRKKSKKGRLFSRRKSFERSQKKAYLAQIDDEIASMKETLHELEISRENMAKVTVTPTTRPASPWGRRKKSPSPEGRRKKPRNRSPEGR